MIHETILTIIITFAINTLLYPIITPFLHKFKFGQQVRDEESRSHLKKQGTPTMGGLIILNSIIITSVLYIPGYSKIIPVLSVTVGFGIIGFLDDYTKTAMKCSEGLEPMQKLVGQFIIIGIFTWYLFSSGEVGMDMLTPPASDFDGGSFLSLGIFFIPALFFIILDTDNGVSFTGDLDGLCTSVTVLVATFLTVAAIGEDMGISLMTGAVVGGLLGFLPFNVYPARALTGDTGSLVLGSLVTASCYMMCMPLFIPTIGLAYLIEMLSVIIQMAYSKRTGGKRIFKMTPIRYHFELYGWSGTRVTAVSAIVTAILCTVAYLGL